jgi:MOSC domain-containing protein YiiM
LHSLVRPTNRMIVRIYSAPKSNVEMISYRSCQAIADKGLEGDRYALGTGFYSGVAEWDAHITLMQIEPLESLAAAHDCHLDPKVLRRNLITRGVDLSSLIGRQFRVGPAVVLRGRKAWPPCSHIVKQSGRKEIFQYLARDTGIGADIVVGGTISLGDAIVLNE